MFAVFIIQCNLLTALSSFVLNITLMQSVTVCSAIKLLTAFEFVAEIRYKAV